MTIDTINQSQRNAARVAGFTFLFAMAVVVVANYGINFRLLVPGNAAETARNIMANETLFRMNIACNLIYVLSVVVLLAALYEILKPVNRRLALVAALCRLVVPVMWSITALNSLSALRLLGDASYLAVFRPEQLQTLARLHLVASYDAYYVGLPFWGVASAVCGYLWFKSRYVPRLLAGFGIVSSGWCVMCAFAFIVIPHFEAMVNAYWFDTPLVISEMVFGIWLLSRGLTSSQRSTTERAG